MIVEWKYLTDWFVERVIECVVEMIKLVHKKVIRSKINLTLEIIHFSEKKNYIQFQFCAGVDVFLHTYNLRYNPHK